jgi:hypothetical protein
MYAFAGPVEEVHVAVPEGRISIAPGSEGEMRVQVVRTVRESLSDEQQHVADQVVLEPEQSDGSVSFIARGPGSQMVWGALVSFDVTVALPRDWAKAGGEQPPGIKLKTAGASVEVRDVTCTLEADTVSGPVTIHGLDGDATVNTVEGDISASECAWRSGRLNSSGARIHAAPAELAAGDVLHLSSSVGDLKVTLPEGADCRVEADTTGGQVRTDIRELQAGIRYSGRSLRAAMGKGAGLLKLQSTTGTIRIEVRSEPEAAGG